MYTIMSGDIPVVEFDENDFNYKILNAELAPIYIVNRGNIKFWIEERAVNSIRANSRAVKSKLGLSRNASDYDTAMKVDAASIIDNYWVKKDGDSRSYQDVLFKANEFFTLALMRDNSALDKKPSRTPELTNIGQQEKGWKLEDGQWWLYKNEPVTEIVSEYITYRLGEILGFDMAEYEITDHGKFIRSKDFTINKYNLQHIDGIMVDHIENGITVTDDDYKYNYYKLKEMSEEYAQQYLDICVLDAICENFDRHSKNYGVLTDRISGAIVSLAPNYDNNNSLLTNTNLDISRKGGVLNMFRNFIKKENIEINLPEISKADIADIVNDAFNIAEFQGNNDMDKTFLCDFIVNGIKAFQK